MDAYERSSEEAAGTPGLQNGRGWGGGRARACPTSSTTAEDTGLFPLRPAASPRASPGAPSSDQQEQGCRSLSGAASRPLKHPAGKEGTRQGPECGGFPERWYLPLPGAGRPRLPRLSRAPGQRSSGSQDVHTNPRSGLGGQGGAWDCISNRLPGAASSAGLWATLPMARHSMGAQPP